jgi:Sec-independent protein secretion pathway component TatC
MWQFGVGVVEIGVILVVVAGASFTKTGRRWMWGVLPCFIVGAAVTPADPGTMLAVALPLTAAFIAGVCASPYLRLSNGS